MEHQSPVTIHKVVPAPCPPCFPGFFSRAITNTPAPFAASSGSDALALQRARSPAYSKGNRSKQSAIHHASGGERGTLGRRSFALPGIERFLIGWTQCVEYIREPTQSRRARQSANVAGKMSARGRRFPARKRKMNAKTQLKRGFSPALGESFPRRARPFINRKFE